MTVPETHMGMDGVLKAQKKGRDSRNQEVDETWESEGWAGEDSLSQPG